MTIYSSTSLKPRFNIDRPGDGHYDIDEWTKLLIQSDNETSGSTTFTDSTGSGSAITVSSGPTHSTTQAKIGTSSIYFAAGGRLNLPTSKGWLFADEELTIDFWWYPLDYRTSWYFSGIQDHNISLAYGHQSTAGASTGKFEFWGSTNGTGWNLLGDGAGGTGQGVAGKLNSLEWQHLAWLREGDTWKIYWNGVQDMSHGSSGTVIAETDDGIKLGSHGNGGYPIYGYMDEFRISQGVARWTENFPVF